MPIKHMPKIKNETSETNQELALAQQAESELHQLLYRMGYKNRATIHGFRITACTALNEMGYNQGAIERQLAHSESNKVRAAYNRSEYMEERTKIMRNWSKFIEAQSNADVLIRRLK